MPGSQLIQSVLRAIDVVEAIAVEDSGWRLGELARMLNLKTSTLHHVLRTLSHRGWIETDGRPPRYRIGAGLLNLVQGERERALFRLGGAALVRLSQIFPHGTFTLGTVSGADLIISLRVSPARPGFLEQHLHRHLHPYGSAAPLLFQAMWPAEDRETFQQTHPFWENGGGEIWQSTARLEKFLVRIRNQGYSLLELPGEKIIKLAVPIKDRSGRILASLGGSMPKRRLPDSERRIFLEKVLAEAGAVARGDLDSDSGRVKAGMDNGQGPVS